ncbi:autotransporter domain-containing protein [Roseomonas elaeocarpi]|uniref:Autotransporter domain-containing protein n=1 Tax=Roseomonas elaeocarpi TaxID=907779 RepID=A0ABV6JU43_9PROT
MSPFGRSSWLVAALASTALVSIPPALAQNVVLAPGQTYDIGVGSGATIDTLNGAAGSRVTLGTNTLTIGAGGSFAGSIQQDGGLTVGGGTLTLGGTNTYTGLTTIQSGATLRLGAGGSLSASTGVFLPRGGTLDLNGQNQTLSRLRGSDQWLPTNNVGGNVVLGSGTLTLNIGPPTTQIPYENIFGGVISGTGALVKTGSSSLWLTGENTYTGGTYILEGELAAGPAYIFPSRIRSLASNAPLFVASGASFYLSQNVLSVTTLGGGGTITLDNASLYVGGDNSDSRFDGQISGGYTSYVGSSSLGHSSEVVAKSGTGTLTLTNPQALYGPVIVGGGVLALTGQASASYAGFSIGGNGVLDLTGTTTTPAILSLDGNNPFAPTVATSGQVRLGSSGLRLTNPSYNPRTIGVSRDGYFNGTISGDGPLILGPEGILADPAAYNAVVRQYLEGVNTYTGGTLIEAGTLVIGRSGNAAARLAGAVSVRSLGALAGYGAIAGSVVSDGVVAPGSEGLLLSPVVGYAPGTGTLRLGGDYTQGVGGTLAVAITPAASSRLDVGGTARLAGTLSLLPLGTGFTLNSEYEVLTAAGGVQGYFQAVPASLDGLPVTVLYGADRVVVVLRQEPVKGGGGGTPVESMVIDRSKPFFTQDDTAARLATVQFNGGTLRPSITTQIPRPVAVSAAGAVVDTRDADLVLSNAVTGGGGLTAQGGGRLTLAGAADLGGAVTAAEGELRVDGTLSAASLEVRPGAVLRGTGTVAAPTAVAGTLAPGNSPGTLRFTAPVTLADGAVLRLDVDGPGTGNGAGNYSRVVVEGAGFTAAGTLAPVLRGITGDATNGYTPPVGQGFTVVAAQGGVAGSFAALAQPEGLAPGTRFDALYGSDTLTLYATPASYAGLAAAGVRQSANERAVGSGLDALRPLPGQRPDAAVAPALERLYPLGLPAVAATIRTLGAPIYGDALVGAVERERLFGRTLSGRLAGEDAPLASGDEVAPFGANGTAWISGLGQHFRTGERGGQTGYTADLGGVSAGAEARGHEDWLAGFALGFTTGRVSSKATGAQARSDTGHLGLYGSWTPGPWYVEAQVTGSLGEAKVRRSLGATGLSVRSDPDTSGVAGEVGAGAELLLGGWRLRPGAGLRVDAQHRDGVRERGAGALGLRVEDDGVTGVLGTLGATASRRFALSPGIGVSPSLRLQWGHDFADVTTGTEAAFAGAQDAVFRVTSSHGGRDRLLAGAGASIDLPWNLAVFASYGVDLRSNYTAQTVTGGISWRW